MNKQYGPPEGWVQPQSFSFNAAADWQRVCTRGLHFEPYSGDTTSATVRGDCLHPLLIEGQDALIIRPYVEGEPLVDGDLYVIAWDDIEDAGVKRYIDARTGKALIAKFLRYICGEWYVQWNEAIAPLNGEVIAKVVGVVALESVNAAQIALGAVTTIVGSTLSALVNASVTGTTASPASNVSMDSFNITTSGQHVQVVCTSVPDGTGDQANSSVTSFQIEYTIFRDGVAINAPAYVFSHQNTYWQAGQQIATPPVTFSFIDPSPAAGTHTYSLRCSVTPTGSGGSITAHRHAIAWSLTEFMR